MNLANRRQRQYQRKYNSYRKYTATEDVSYATHTSRSSYRSESMTSRSSDRGRSSSSEIIAVSETRSLPVYIAIQDYVPEPGDSESISLEQGQIVEVLDKKNAASWLIRTKARPPKSGWVPGSYFESPTEYYKQRRRTRELVNKDLNLTDEQEAIMKRDQVYHDLLRSEEEFVNELRMVVDTYVKALNDANIPEEVKAQKDELVMNLRQLHNFHANIMLKGLQYYSDDPNKVGQTFTRLSRDFDLHVQFHHNLPRVQELLQQKTINDFLQDLSNKIEAGAKTFDDHLQNVADRIVQYQNYFKEFVKYASRAKLNTKTMQKVLELMMSVPERATDMVHVSCIEQYPGDLNKLGRLYRHDSFLVWEGEKEPVERHVFLFKNKLMFTERNNSGDVPTYKHYATIRLDKYTIRVSEVDPDIFELKPNEPGLLEFQIRAKDVQSMEFIRQAWLKDISEMKGHDEQDMEMETISELDITMSDGRSEFSEYSTISRSLLGPEEGPPRKKIKSPPVISPTASTTSLYSGGSSTIDWTTTGTTLDMQGTRVTRTQYGFRTLQESSAKMCLKVTGYPLPEITWYKDDQMLHEDERHTFYADEDGFFALTIDPVQVEDTGRYTCMATNEYGQASTSAFFKVLKVEKETAPPAFVTPLQDQEVKEGEVVSFECEVEGWPEPELVWLVDEQPLRPSHDFKLEYDGQNAKLEIRDAQPDDSGVYSVRIKNEYGSAESKATLTVEPDPDKNYIAPEFQAVIEDAECNEGDTVKFKAVLTGDPSPEVVWMINGVPLSESEKIKFISEDGICILTITDVSRHFDGIVTCQGVNRLGTENCDAQLRVRVPPSPPHFEHPLEDKILQEQQAVVLETEVSGFPEPNVSFRIKGKPIVSGENGIEIVNKGNGCYRIEISRANIDLHDGEIVCTATNDYGQAESRGLITVKPFGMNSPTFVKDIEDQTVTYGEMATFETSVRGSPNPEISWFINGEKVDETTRGIRIEAQSATDHKLIVDSAHHAGTITCRAENSAGCYETKARLITISGEKRKHAPEFVEKLLNASVTEESDVVFEVRVEAEPRANLRWFLNDEELIESTRIKIREFDGSWKLEMNGVAIEDSGIIRCVAENSEGVAESSAHLTVNKKPLAPQFTDRPKNVTVERGEEAQFRAYAIAVPEPSYQWFIGGRKITQTMKGVKVESISGGVSALTIDTKIFDSSTISVTATNSVGVDETGALLTVQEGKRDLKPAIKKALHDQSVKRGEMTNFEVSIEPNEVVTEWYCNGNKLVDGMPGVKFLQQNSDFKLTIDSALYAGVITFKASNKAGEAESSANLVVTQGKPEFLNALNDIVAKEGDRVEVAIATNGKANFEWALNGKTLQDGVEGVTIKNYESKSVLVLEKILLKQAGDIEVTATNEGGQASSSFNMAVTERDKAPEIITGPNSLSIKENDTAEFRAEIIAKPAPTVKWQLNGRELSASDANITIKSFESVYILKIERANVKHAGEVIVVAENAIGKAEKEAVLKVEPDLTKPVFKTHLIDRCVNEGEPLRWDTAIERPYNGVTIGWLLNGKELTNNENVQIIDDGDGKYHITINEAKLDMCGTLIARATNSCGTSESHASVEVIEVARKPEILRAPQDHEVEESETVKFSAIISGKPIPTVSWYMDGVKLENSNEVGMKFDATAGKTSIRILKAKLSDSGKKITMKAENTEGKVEASAMLTVNKKLEPPNIQTEIKSRQVSEGETVSFSTKITGYPIPEVAWFCNGQPIVPSSNMKITEENGTHTLVLNDVQLEQGGEISCEAKNSVGSKKQLATLVVKPSGKAPFFERNIQDKLVVEGEGLIMDAKLAQIKPIPTISWLRDGKPLRDDRFKVNREEDGTLQLKIDSVQLGDKSRITIRAENQFGSADCSASIGVTKKRPMAKPAFLSDIPATTINEGDSLNVKVIITGDPVPFTKWYINDQLVVATEDTEMKEENGVHSLTIHGCTKDMTGTIKCVAYNKAGEVTTQGPLTVLTPIPVEFETSLCDAVCREGDTLKLKAVLMGEPAPQVSWYINGKKLKESQNIKIHAEKGTYTVTIKNITCDYSGKVVCEAINEFGRAVSEASLLVLPRGEPPDFIEWLSNVKARQGSQVTHKVVFTGDPKPNLTWYINNEEVKDSDEITIVTDDNTSTLVIKNFNEDKHTGEIICKAENDAGEVSCTASMGPYTSDMFSESQTESEVMAEEVLNIEDGPELGGEMDSIDEMQRTPTPIMAPKFITKIKDTRAARGQQAIFECVVPNTKGVCCKWLKDGREIELVARIRVQTRAIEDQVAIELIIDDVSPEDAGKYTVVVHNTAGKDSCEATLNVIEALVKPIRHEPEFVVAIQDKTCSESEKVIFECKVVGEPQPTITWFHGKTPIAEEAGKRVIESDGAIQRLVIVSADVTDRGQYTCLAENSEGKTESKATLAVLETAHETIQDAGPPVFTELLKSCTVTENAEIILHCKLKGMPRPAVSWTKNNVKLSQNNRITTEYHGDGTVVLKIRNARKEDIGEYRCDAVNKFGAAWTAGPVRIVTEAELQKQGEEPDFIEPIKPITVRVGEVAVLEGKVKGQPKPEVKWFKGENMVKESANIELENLPDGTQRLIVRKVAIEDAGEYRCIASNKYGDVWSDVTLVVQVPASEEEDEIGHAPPAFLKTLGGICAKESEHVVLECKIVGDPMPEIKWFKDKEEISANDAHFKKETLSDGTARLIIDSALKDDSGEFRCEARNPFGVARTDATLIVNYEFEVPVESEIAPEFLQELKLIQAIEKERVSFECRVAGVPVPEVKWFKDGDEIKPSEHVRIESLSDGTNRLVIDSVNIEDQGNYRCEATNSAGSMSSKAPLTVNELETLRLKKGLSDAVVKIGSKIHLSVEVEGKPKRVKWFHGKNEVKADNRTKFDTITGYECKLEIGGAVGSDAGTYHVVLSNDTNTVESFCTVNVLGSEVAPVFRRSLQDQSIPKGSKLLLEVEVDGTPKQIKWLKDGKPIDDKIVKTKDLGNGKYQLVVDEVNENNAGAYTVQISNDTGTVASNANITLISEKPEIISGLKPTIAKLGDKVILEVETKGPIKQVKWYKNGIEAKNIDKKQIGSNKYQLIIDKATKDDEADYEVVLSNDGGEAQSSAKLTVKMPKIEFTEHLENETLDVGTKATLSISTNLPPKQVKWYKNGKEITAGDKAKPNKLNDNTYQLVIPDTDKDDSAEYKVVVITDDDTADSSCALTVKLPALIITRGLQDQTVNAGEKVLLNVEVNAPPKLVRWYKNGREITSSDKAKVKKANDKNYQLEICNVAEDDAFDYKVILSNDEGSVESSCVLTVKIPADKPTIKKGIVDQFIAVGKPLEIIIETTGKPKVVKWYKNGHLLSSETNKLVKEEKIDENKYVLKIEKCALSDSGTYSVEVQNEAGQAKSSGEVGVEDKLTFLKPLQDIEVIEAGQAVLMVETNIHPRIVKWYKNGQEVKPISGRTEMKNNATKFQLIINKVEIDDAANYKVVLSNSAGDIDSSAKLTVKKSKGQPKIIKGLEDQAVAKGSELTLEIKVEEEPTEVRWLKNGTAFPKNAEAKIEKINEQTYRLTIPQVDTTDAGTYSVEVINEIGKVRSSGNVEVDVKPEITKGLENCEVSEGDEQLFEVETNVPIREVKWYKNGQEIKPSPKITTKQITSKKFELVIAKASLDDTATYKVTLSNKAGVCDSSASLAVSKLSILKVLSNLKDVEVNEGEPIKLSVKVEGLPKTIKWLKNGQEIKPDDRVQIKGNIETGEYTLTILGSVPSDDAAYRVVLSNGLGDVQSSSITRVKSKKEEPVTSAATFVTPLEDVNVPEGDNLTLKCKVSGEPVPTLKWYKNGVEITKDDRIVMRMALDGTATLRVLNSKREDAGRYSVLAVNPIGESKSECNVRVLDAEELPSEPKFVIPLKDVVAEIGTKAEFNIKVRGVPKPTLTWSIANRDVTQLNGIKIEDMGDGNWTMLIENITEEFIGRIKCVATNVHGKVECESQLTQRDLKHGRTKAEEGYPPKFNVPLWDRRILEGQVATIECHVDAKPPADIVWRKDGVILAESDRIEIRNTPDGACRVRINNFGKDDVGSYKCNASNALGVADTKSNLSIQITEREDMVTKKQFPPRFNPPLVDKFADVDETVRLTCKVDALPKAAITWYKDGVPLRSNSHVVIENDDDGNCLLTINHSAESDDGAYRCVATNDIGSSNSACMVSIHKLKEEVKKGGEEPFFIKGLVDKWLGSGEKLTLQCTVIGDPKPEIRWYRNGILLRANNKISMGNTSDGVCTLTIDECAVSDEGIYRCDAENCNGKARTQSTVHIERPIEKLNKKIVEGQAPQFIIPLQDVTLYIGSTIDLECKVTGDPMPTVKWSKDGMIIRDDSRYQWETDASIGTYRLKINDANVSDEGAYRCVATNAAGSATTKAFVRIDDGNFIQRPSTNEPPRFTIALGCARAFEGQPLIFECKIEGSPLTDLVWYKDGERIIPDHRITTECNPDGRLRLVISSCNVNDEGLYRVIATNPFGSIHSKGTATVKKILQDATNGFLDGEKFDVYRAPRVIVPLESTKVAEGSNFVLRCKFSGDPRPKIKWFKNGERIYTYGHCTLTESEDGNCELTVKNADRFDGGCYRCVAENIYGSDRTTCEVSVQLKEKPQRNFEDEIREGKAPGFSVPLTMKRAKLGDTVILECVPYGKPFPEIKWLKDGIEVEVNDRIKIESLDDKAQRIILKDIDFFAEGFYRCIATNEYGTASTKAEVVLEGDRTMLTKKMDKVVNEEPVESKPRIRRGLYDMSVHQGNTIEMQVCTSGWPTPTVKWLKNGEELKSSGPDGPVVVWTDKRGIHHCVVVNASPQDEAEYALEATNKHGTVRTEGAITIIRPREVPGYENDRDRGGLPYPPGFIRQLKNKHVFSHMPTVFDCLVVGYPPPEVEWFHDGKRITPGGRISIQSCGGGSHALIIMDTLPEDAGEYVAIARNGQGQASSRAILDVTVPLLDSIKFDGSVDVTPYLTEEYGFKKIPHHSIPTPPDRGPFIKEVTGHYLTLSWIPTKRAPPRYPQVTYVIEIRELPQKDWVLLDYNIPEPVCKVRNLELGKSYQFRVRAENIYGISDPSPASPPSRLMAPPQPVLDKNKRVIPLLDPYAERALYQAHAEQYACAPWFAPVAEEKRFCGENEVLSITLCVSGSPDPKIVWKFHNMDIDTGPTSRIRVQNHTGVETTLTITGFSKEDVGQYQCIATNQYGGAQQTILVGLGARPKFIQPLINKVVPGGKPLRLDVRVEGSPFPQLKWMKDWQPLVKSSHVSFVREGNLCSLIISEPLWCDCGIYSVTAINDAGTATTSCSVTIQADEEFSMVHHDIRNKKSRIALESRKVREIYEIDENDEKAAAAGAPFHVTEIATRKRFLAQLRALDENLARNIEMQNNLDHPTIIQLHQALMDQGIAVLVYANVNRSLLDSFISNPSKTIQHTTPTERQVQVIVRQLLHALKCMHDKKIAHLDIRPEVILLEDDHLRLAGFDQSRRLVRGKVVANIMGSPEFVSPEIAAGVPVTLASDLWSVGALTYVLLSGVSPFLGDTDNETVRNVMLANYAFDIEEFEEISNAAKDFISKLLVLDPSDRLSVDQALHHPWILQEFPENVPKTSECSREFKYNNKWLERRLFVQQTSSDQPMGIVQVANATLTGSNLPQHMHVQGLASSSEPDDICDYLRIKDRISSHDVICESSSKRHLQPQEKGEAPARWLLQQTPHTLTDYFDDTILPTQLVHGEHRQIEEEIANRILSDISEETSITGSVISYEEPESLHKMSEKQIKQKKSRSKSSTPQVDGFSLDGTSIPSPCGTGSAGTSIPEYYSYTATSDMYRYPTQLDPSIPVGAPIFLEGLENQHLVLDDALTDAQSPHARSPRTQSPRSLPGTKSPVLLSPKREYTMGVVIGIKQGAKGVTEIVMSKPELLGVGEVRENHEEKHDDEFENFMNKIEEMKKRRKKEREELERLRPKNVYDDDTDFKKPDTDDDEFPWDSNYQIGPDTLLLATRGAGFNARVRDYRRELWGDGAPLVNQGYLGCRNRDITVRERRRFTDLIREDQNIAKSVENLELSVRGTHLGAIRRIRSDISKAIPAASKENGTFGAIFRNRLKDLPFTENGCTVVFKCAVVGNPHPTVEWFFNESSVTDDHKHKIFYENGNCQLTIEAIDLTDLGEYSCVASNEHGVDRTSARLITGDTPARPGRPEVELSSDTEVFVTWEAPQISHCLECFMYKLEVRPAGENDHFSEWRLVSDKIGDEAAVVRYLTPQGIYQFRVTARNEFGWGVPSLISRIIQTHPKGSPKLQIEKLQEHCRLCVISKPPQTRIISKSQQLGEIMEEDEEKTEVEENGLKPETQRLTLNNLEEPLKRFQLIAPIPRGRFGEIVFATDKSRKSDTGCMAKIRNINVGGANGTIEFEALNECQHENVASVIAAYHWNESLFLFMERYEEDIFQRFIYRNSYNEEQISRVIAQIASALHWIHFKGYIHMDVQATNVLFTSRQSWQIKITDFASAQKIGSEIKQPAKPNPYWASPEILRTDEKKVPITAQTDIWGLGVITFCLLSGFHPFAGPDDSDDEVKDSTIYQKCNPNLIQVQATNESLRFVTWALKKNPTRRMRTDEALSHRWLSMDSVMIRRRETVNYPSSRLRRTAVLTANPTKYN